MRRPSRCLLGVALAALACANGAHADEADPAEEVPDTYVPPSLVQPLPPEPEHDPNDEIPYPYEEPGTKQKVTRHWYGWMTLAVDVPAITVAAVGLAVDSAPAAYSGLVSYLVGAPIIHAAHGKAGTPFASLGLRTGLPLGMAVLLVPAEGDSPDAIAAALVAFGVGAAGAVALDAAVLAFAERPATATVAWRPSIVVQPSRWTVGAVGVF